MSKSLVHLKDFSKDEVYKVFEIADMLKENKYTGKPLQGKTVILFFPDTSIRTRVTFEKGIRDLGGNTILFPSSGLDKKEDIKDVIGYLENWADAVAVRHNDLGLVEKMAEVSRIPIVNAMTSTDHPCEILTDLYSLSKIRKDFTRDQYLFVGANGNIGNTWKEAAQVMGFSLVQCCPEGYEIDGLAVCYELESAVRGKDIVCTDSIPAAIIHDFSKYQVTMDCMKKANMGAVLNPCPPFYRGEEVSAEVLESGYFVGYQFKKPLVEVQQAILCYLLGSVR